MHRLTARHVAEHCITALLCHSSLTIVAVAAKAHMHPRPFHPFHICCCCCHCYSTGAGDDDSGHQTASQAMPPPPAKPIAIASLGVGGAAAASRQAAAAAALAALQAAALPPRQLVSEVTGPTITVTGSTGARVYCQMAATAAAAAATGTVSRGLAGSGSRSGLLQQPIGDLLDMLAERRRQVGSQACARQGGTYD
jgi:hypothetical protein